MRRSCTALAASPRFELNKRFLNEAFVKRLCTYVCRFRENDICFEVIWSCFSDWIQRNLIIFNRIQLVHPPKVAIRGSKKIMDIGEMLFHLIFKDISVKKLKRQVKVLERRLHNSSRLTLKRRILNSGQKVVIPHFPFIYYIFCEEEGTTFNSVPEKLINMSAHSPLFFFLKAKYE